MRCIMSAYLIDKWITVIPIFRSERSIRLYFFRMRDLFSFDGNFFFLLLLWLLNDIIITRSRRRRRSLQENVEPKLNSIELPERRRRQWEVEWMTRAAKIEWYLTALFCYYLSLFNKISYQIRFLRGNMYCSIFTFSFQQHCLILRWYLQIIVMIDPRDFITSCSSFSVSFSSSLSFCSSIASIAGGTAVSYYAPIISNNQALPWYPIPRKSVSRIHLI